MSTIRNTIVGVLGIGIVSAGAFAFDNTTRNESGEIVESGELGVFSLEVGDCLNGLDWTQETVSSGLGVPCSEQHNYEVFYETFYEGMTLSEIQRASSEACEANFESYVGSPYEASSLYFTALTPTQESYEAGDREVTCLLHNEAETLVTGTWRNSGQ
jgi:hypothetical protein